MAAKKKKPTRKKAPAKRKKIVARKQPETLRLRGATPGLTVNDVNKSVAWYRDVLGFVVGDLWKDGDKLMGAELRTGTVTFVIGQDDWKKGRDRKKGEGFRMYCTTAQDVDSLAAQIRAKGGVLSHGPQDEPWGVRDFGLTDPDGFKITIQGPLKAKKK